MLSISPALLCACASLLAVAAVVSASHPHTEGTVQLGPSPAEHPYTVWNNRGLTGDSVRVSFMLTV